MKTLLVAIILIAFTGKTHLSATITIKMIISFSAANPIPTNDENQNDWQLVPDDKGKFHLVNIKSIDVTNDEPPFVGMRDMVFRLFTRNNLNTPQVVRINNQGDLSGSFFNPQHQTRFMIHGWLGGGDGDNDNGEFA